MTGAWDYSWDHLVRMADGTGLFEHAQEATPRFEHGYCTDDNARLLVVTSRGESGEQARVLSELALRFVLHAQDPQGRVHNRLDRGRGWEWSDAAGTEDWWGRALWGLGVAATCHPDELLRDQALRAFRVSALHRSPFVHSMTFAALGAIDVLAQWPDNVEARMLLEDARVAIVRGLGTQDWPWPQPRLTYASACLAEAMIGIGMVLEDVWSLKRGLAMLDWLMSLQLQDAHLSVVGVGGRGPGDQGPQFDQQPIEVAAVADACWRAWIATGQRHWLTGVVSAAEWFEGVNDVGVRMYDESTGGGYDGLTPDGPNRNQGAESTLAYISTMQRARALRPTGLLFSRQRRAVEPMTSSVPASG